MGTVKVHLIDLRYSCGCIVEEEIEAAVYAHELEGQNRYCTKHKKDVTIANVGMPFWVDKEQEAQ